MEIKHIANYNLPHTCNIIKNFPESWGEEYKSKFLLGYYELATADEKNNNETKSARIGMIQIYGIDKDTKECILECQLENIEAIFEVCFNDLSEDNDKYVYCAMSDGTVKNYEIGISKGKTTINPMAKTIYDTKTNSVLVNVKLQNDFLMALGQDSYCHLFSISKKIKLISWKTCDYEPWCCTFLSNGLVSNAMSEEEKDFCLYVASGSDDCELNINAILFNYKGIDPSVKRAASLINPIKDEQIEEANKLSINYEDYDISYQNIKKIKNYEAGITMIYSFFNEEGSIENECPVYNLIICKYNGTIEVLNVSIFCTEYVKINKIMDSMQIGNTHGIWRLDWYNKLCVAASMRNGISILKNFEINKINGKFVPPEIIIESYIEPTNPIGQEKLVYEAIFKSQYDSIFYVSFYDKQLTHLQFVFTD